MTHTTGHSYVDLVLEWFSIGQVTLIQSKLRTEGVELRKFTPISVLFFDMSCLPASGGCELCSPLFFLPSHPPLHHILALFLFFISL